MRAAFADLPGWRLMGCGLFHVEQDSGIASPDLARRLVREAGVLMLPGTMFMPESDPAGGRQMRIAFANVDRAGIAELARRLTGWHP